MLCMHICVYTPSFPVSGLDRSNVCVCVCVCLHVHVCAVAKLFLSAAGLKNFYHKPIKHLFRHKPIQPVLVFYTVRPL